MPRTTDRPLPPAELDRIAAIKRRVYAAGPWPMGEPHEIEDFQKHALNDIQYLLRTVEALNGAIERMISGYPY